MSLFLRIISSSAHSSLSLNALNCVAEKKTAKLWRDLQVGQWREADWALLFVSDKISSFLARSQFPQEFFPVFRAFFSKISTLKHKHNTEETAKESKKSKFPGNFVFSNNKVCSRQSKISHRCSISLTTRVIYNLTSLCSCSWTRIRQNFCLRKSCYWN